jgi:uncharacterized membrane protein YvbJ
MPLMRCPDCQKEISESAIACPNCGLPRPQYEQMSRERQQAEADAAAERRELVRNCQIAATVLFVGAAALTLMIVIGSWSREALALKGKLFLGAAITGGSGYGVFRYAKRLKAGA